MSPLNYLLVMPRLVEKVGDGYSFPLGIAYISAAMKAAGFNVSTLNLNHHEGSVPDLVAEAIAANDIDVVATGGLSFQYTTLRSVLEAARAAKPGVRTIVGGGIITADPETAIEALELCDIGVIGEGEETIVELCAALEGDGDISGVAGIVYRDGDRFVVTERRKEIENINDLPWPDYEGFELEAYLAASPSISGLNRRNTVFMIASRSCPFACTFCFHTVGTRYRQRSIDKFFEELDYMISRYDIDYICLADELFSHKVDRMFEFCERMKTYGIGWWAQFRVSDITPEILPVLKEAGCDVMSFGLESADNRILKSMRKHTTVEQIESTLKMVYDAGISLEGAFIFGDIEETWETASNTLKWWRDHSEYKINLNLITVYPGSYLYKYAFEQGIITDKVKFLRDGCPQIRVSKLTDDEYAILLREIMEEPMTLAKVLSTIEVKHIEPATGRIDVAGTCTVCRLHNDWDGIKLFTTNFLACKECGQRYNLVLPQELRDNIDRNVEALVERFGKVAFWGVNYHTSDLFRGSEKLRTNPNVFAVDISSGKQQMDLYGKSILPASIIEEEGIGAVIIAIPVYLSQIRGQVAANHPGVQAVFDVCGLVEPDLPAPIA